MYSLGLADLVDVAGEVDHLVGEAPLVVTHASSRRKSESKPTSALYKISTKYYSVVIPAMTTFFIPDYTQML